MRIVVSMDGCDDDINDVVSGIYKRLHNGEEAIVVSKTEMRRIKK